MLKNEASNDDVQNHYSFKVLHREKDSYPHSLFPFPTLIFSSYTCQFSITPSKTGKWVNAGA
jgi:hypothetical protein